MRSDDYERLAVLFSHPGAEYLADVERAIRHFDVSRPAVASALRDFQRRLPQDDPLALEELYTRTFDVQPITSLEIGYTLFGEDYKRGALLAGLSREHTQAENDCGFELADHLGNVLRLLPKIEDTEIRQELVHVMVAPAVREMVREFEPERMKKKEKLYKKHHKTLIESAPHEVRIAFRHALEATLAVLQADFGVEATEPERPDSKFVAAIGAELGIEDSGRSAAR